ATRRCKSNWKMILSCSLDTPHLSSVARSTKLGSTERNQSSPQTRSRRMRDRPGFDVRDNVDVAVCGFGIWTLLVRTVHQRLGDFAIYAREVDVEASLNEVTAAGCAQIHFGVNGELSRQLDFHSGGHDLDCR